MAMTPIFSPNPTSPFSLTTKHNHTFPSLTHHHHHHNKNINILANDKSHSLLPRVASSIPYQPLNVDYMEAEFSGHGVTFEALGESCVVNMSLDNGSTAIMMLPAGLITSYKAAMWHRGTDEMIHSLVTEDASSGNAVLGGVSLTFEFRAGDGVSWSPSNWALHRIRGNSHGSIEVELLCTDSRDKIEVKHIVTLHEDELSSDIVIKNSGSSTAQMTGFVLSHLRVSSPEATFAIGLEGSDFFVRPPLMSDFCVVPPEYGTDRKSRFGRLMDKLSFWNRRNGDEKNNEREQPDEELEGEEYDNYKNLSDEMSLIYTSAPRNMTVIDRGRRNSVTIGRKGFEELYMFSPGSSYGIYGKYSYICVGQSAMLKPITAEPGQVLRLGQDLYNPNL